MCPQSYTCMDVDILSMDPFQTKISYSLLHRLTLFALCIWALISVSEMVTQAIFCFSTGFHKWRLWGLIQGSRIHETADRYHWLLRSSEAQAMGFAGSLGRGDMRKMPGLRLGLLEACQPAKHVVHDSLCCTMNPAMWVFRAMLNCHPVLTLQTRSAFWYFCSPWFFTRFITVILCHAGAGGLSRCGAWDSPQPQQHRHSTGSSPSRWRKQPRISANSSLVTICRPWG